MKTNETPAEAAAGVERHDAEIDAKIAWLDTCRTALDAHGLAVLDEVFTPFMLRHYGKVRRRARRWGVPQSDARDFVQEVFIALHVRVEAHGVKSSLLTTLHIVTRGKLLHDARARRGIPTTVGIPSSESALPESSVDVERAIDLRTARKFVHELSAKRQAVVTKVLLEDKTIPEAAAELGLSEKTVDSRLRDAIRQLRALAEPWLPKSQRKA